MKENDKMDLKIATVMREVEIVFPVSAERAQCASFFASLVALIRDPQTTELKDVETLQRIELYGRVYGKPGFQDGGVIDTSPVVKIEKMRNQTEPTVLERFYLRSCWWKRIRQSFRFVTQSGSTYIVPMANFSKKTYRLLDATRYGAIDEMEFRRGLF